MVRRYTWMLCVAILCLLWLSNSLTHTTAAATPVATPALTLLQDDDAESSDADEDKSVESGEDEAEEEKEEAAFKPTAGSLSYLKIGLSPVLHTMGPVRRFDQPRHNGVREQTPARTGDLESDFGR